MQFKKEDLVKSPLNYTGGKFKLLPQILPYFPNDINTFVDLFAGGCNVGINVKANEVIANDHNTFVIDLFNEFNKNTTKDIINHIETRIEEYKLSKENEEGFKMFRDYYNSTKMPLDLYTLVCYSFNYQFRFNSDFEFNGSFGRKRSQFSSVLKSKLIKFLDVLHNKNISFICNDFIDISTKGFKKDDFIYCDPPYLISTASYNDGNRGFKNWTETEERMLLEYLDKVNQSGIKFALSNVLEDKNKTNNILKEWSKKYNVNYLNHTYSNCNYHAKDKSVGGTVEVLITNY
jgi:adenine-specific DNA-methyltransferase